MVSWMGKEVVVVEERGVPSRLGIWQRLGGRSCLRSGIAFLGGLRVGLPFFESLGKGGGLMLFELRINVGH